MAFLPMRVHLSAASRRELPPAPRHAPARPMHAAWHPHVSSSSGLATITALSACSHGGDLTGERVGELLEQPIPSTSSPMPTGASRRRSSPPATGLLRDSDTLELESFLRVFKARQPASGGSGPGRVYLVGTGPGDPGLLTLRAVQMMQSADVVLYDRLVSDEILQLVHPGARMVYVGKQAGLHTRSQDEIHTLLLAFAEAGARVLRLKGGDPYVYGRGGEEVQYLQARGIQVHCVPGITAAAGICAELGIPMTHRGIATSARFLTGHSRSGGEEVLGEQVVAAGADAHTTLIVYMGLQTLPTLRKQLIANGMSGAIPSVAVERGTTDEQRVVFAPLAELAERTQRARLQSPTLLIIGEVVALAPGWQQWQEQGRPLEWQAAGAAEDQQTHGSVSYWEAAAQLPSVLGDDRVMQVARNLAVVPAGQGRSRARGAGSSGGLAVAE